MTLSIIINTCALGPKATETTPHQVEAPYALRRYALANFILPMYIHDPLVSEVIVVGEWCEGEGYTYVHVPSRHFSSDDAVMQRQAGFEASTGDVLVFSHDDHILHPRTTHHIDTYGLDADVVVFGRFARTTGGDVELNNGGQDGYIGGHCVAYKRHVLEVIPWKDVPEIREWDRAQTMLLEGAGFSVSWPSFPSVYDIELGASAT